MAAVEDISARTVKLVKIQNSLLDYTGHVYAYLSPKQRANMVRDIQALRESLGWRLLDMNGR